MAKELLAVLLPAPFFERISDVASTGVSALTSGLTTFPEAVGILISTQLVTRMYPTIGPRRLITGGLTGVAIIMGLMSLIGHDTDLWLVRALMFLTGAGMAFAFVPVQAAAFATISTAETGHASALFNAQRQVGASLGVALLSTVISVVGLTQLSASGAVVPNFTAYHAAFMAAALFALTAASIALTIHDSDAAATMKRKAKRARQEIVANQALGAE